jgi:hypothetical protein
MLIGGVLIVLGMVFGFTMVYVGGVVAQKTNNNIVIGCLTLLSILFGGGTASVGAILFAIAAFRFILQQ